MADQHNVNRALLDIVLHSLTQEQGAIVAEQPPPVTERSANGLVWLVGSVLTSTFFNGKLSEAIDTVSNKLREKVGSSKCADVVGSVSSVSLASLFIRVVCGVSVSYIWAFKKAQRGGRLSKMLFWVGMSAMVFAIVVNLVCLAVINGAYFAT